jgi:circadian clock protein KaiA
MEHGTGDTSNAPISICTLVDTGSPLYKAIADTLADDYYHILACDLDSSDCLDPLLAAKNQVDCLIFETSNHLPLLLSQLQDQGIILPAIQITPAAGFSPALSPVEDDQRPSSYHPAEIYLGEDALGQLPHSIRQAIASFLRLNIFRRISGESQGWFLNPPLNQALIHHQQRLSDKLKERSGYLGVYYKRNPAEFLRKLPPELQRQLLAELEAEYREIVLIYFQKGSDVNTKIDTYVAKAFFADISISHILEIHMHLMDSFAKQLKLEGRSDDILLDYRLTLIDTIAHLCELYRRCIPREA